VITQHHFEASFGKQKFKMKKLSTLLLTAIASLSICSGQVNKPDQKTIEQWQESSKSPNIGLALIEDFKIVHSEVYGDMGEIKNAESEVLFDIASVTKSFSAYTVLSLVAEGKWDLNEPLANYWVDPDVKDNPYAQKLTTKHVLNHQTGFKNWRWMNESKKLEFDFEPGTKVQYSGEGFEYMRRAVEKKFGKSLDVLAKEQFYKKAKIKNSHYIWNDKIDEEKVTIGHDENGAPMDLEKQTEIYAANCMLTTVDDLANFSIAVMKKKGISEELFAELITPQANVRPGVSFGYAYIIFDDLPNGEYAIANFGSDPGVNAATVFFPERGDGMVITTTSVGGRAVVMKAIAEVFGESGKAIISRF